MAATAKEGEPIPRFCVIHILGVNGMNRHRVKLTRSRLIGVLESRAPLCVVAAALSIIVWLGRFPACEFFGLMDYEPLATRPGKCRDCEPCSALAGGERTVSYVCA